MKSVGFGKVEIIRAIQWAATVIMLALPAPALAEMGHAGHGGMSGMPGMGSEQGGMKMDGHSMSKMGDRIFSGKIGALHGEARIMDMKSNLEASGMKAQGAMPNSHHIALSLFDPKTNNPITDGVGTITVIGPDKKSVKSEFIVMQGHFGADVNLPKSGNYTFLADIQSEGQGGNATFTYTMK